MNLSTRQKEILKLVGENLTSKEIANKLNISPRTVQSCLENIYWKTKSSGKEARLHAYAYAIEHHLLD